MTQDHHARGGAAVGAPSRMEARETNLLVTLCLWCEGPHGLVQGSNKHFNTLSGGSARKKCYASESFIQKLVANAMRPLAGHDFGFCCVGADECVFPHLVPSATDSDLNKAALFTRLAVEPPRAGQIASLAGQLGLACENPQLGT